MHAKLEELDKELGTHATTLAKGRLGGKETRALWHEIDELLDARYLLCPTRQEAAPDKNPCTPKPDPECTTTKPRWRSSP